MDEPKKYYFKDFLGRIIGPFPNEEIALQADWDFNTYLWEAYWKMFHAGFMYR